MPYIICQFDISYVPDNKLTFLHQISNFGDCILVRDHGCVCPLIPDLRIIC